MRTVRRHVITTLNRGKREALAALVRAYAAEKRHWLDLLARRDTRPLLATPRQVRDAAVAAHYVPASGLQARLWKLALTDAAATWDHYWKALFVDLRCRVARRQDFDATARHYAHWLMKGYVQFFACLEGETPAPPFAVEPAGLHRIAVFVRRQAAKQRGRNPVVHL